MTHELLFGLFKNGDLAQSSIAAAQLLEHDDIWGRVEEEIRTDAPTYEFNRLAAAYPGPISDVKPWFDRNEEGLRQMLSYRDDGIDYLARQLESEPEWATMWLVALAVTDDWEFMTKTSLPESAVPLLETIDSLDAKRLLVRHDIIDEQTLNALLKHFGDEVRAFDGDYDMGCWLQDVVMDVSHAADDRFIPLLAEVLKHADGPLAQVTLRALSRFPNATSTIEGFLSEFETEGDYADAIRVAARCALQVCRRRFDDTFFDDVFSASDRSIFSMVVLATNARALVQIDPSRVFDEVVDRVDDVHDVGVVLALLRHLGSDERAVELIQSLNAWDVLWEACQSEKTAEIFAAEDPIRFVEQCGVDETLFRMVESWALETPVRVHEIRERLWERFPLLQPEYASLVTQQNWRVVHRMPANQFF